MTLTLTDIPYQLLLEVSTSVKITERESFLVFYMFFFSLSQYNWGLTTQPFYLDYDNHAHCSKPPNA